MFTIITGITYSLVIATIFRKIILLSTGPEVSTSFVRKRNRRFLAIIFLFLTFFDMTILIPWTVLSPLVPSNANFKIPVIGEFINMISCILWSYFSFSFIIILLSFILYFFIIFFILLYIIILYLLTFNSSALNIKVSSLVFYISRCHTFSIFYHVIYRIWNIIIHCMIRSHALFNLHLLTSNFSSHKKIPFTSSFTK